MAFKANPDKWYTEADFKAIRQEWLREHGLPYDRAQQVECVQGDSSQGVKGYDLEADIARTIRDGRYFGLDLDRARAISIIERRETMKKNGAFWSDDGSSGEVEA